VAVDGDAVFVIHFWAIWNGVDRLYGPVLETLQKEFEDQIEFRSVDADAESSRALVESLRVWTLPTLGVFARGREAALIPGKRDADHLRAAFAKSLQEA
jgi:thiol-disulfide isomerase/thioredoxin